MKTGCVAGVEAVMTALDELDAAWEALVSLPVDGLDADQALAVLDRIEVHRRRLPAVEHGLISHVQAVATPAELGAKSWRVVLSNRLGISAGDAGRRLVEASRLGARRTVTGEPLAPELAATAAAQARGEIGVEHVGVIRDFMAHLPADVDPGTRQAAESQLGGLAGGLTPEGLRVVARQLLGYLDQDGTLDDGREHARKRGITLGPQELDGMSRLTGWVDPALRAGLEAILAKLAGPGYANPDDEHPCVDGAPTQDQIAADTRTGAQRTHDAVATVCTAMLASGKLGQHNGLPVTIVATATLTDLSAAAGRAHTGGGALIPIPTLLNMAATHGAHPYLALFKSPRKIRLYYGRSRRTASPGQRLVLHATDRGCTKPGCTTPAYQCQVHHGAADWQHGGNTNIDELTLACPRDNRLVDHTTPTGWTTRKHKADTRTQWLPPPQLDRGQSRINLYHHPEKLLHPDGPDRPDRPNGPDRHGQSHRDDRSGGPTTNPGSP